MPQWKTVRVFLSSTFRDMHAERDHLVKVTFPAIRQWCAERHLFFDEIDLRWGITRQEADEGEVVSDLPARGGRGETVLPLPARRAVRVGAGRVAAGGTV